MTDKPAEIPEEAIRAGAMALLDNLMLQADVEEWQTADSYVALTTNAETYDIHLTGPFDDPERARAWAREHEIDLNKGNPPSEIPFTVTVYPMRNPS